MLKDLRLSQQAAEARMPTRRWACAGHELYAAVSSRPRTAGRDFSAMLPRFEKRGRG
jgi:3-hydroxyisobutyrate dehydrogenase